MLGDQLEQYLNPLFRRERAIKVSVRLLGFLK